MVLKVMKELYNLQQGKCTENILHSKHMFSYILTLLYIFKLFHYSSSKLSLYNNKKNVQQNLFLGCVIFAWLSDIPAAPDPVKPLLHKLLSLLC